MTLKEALIATRKTLTLSQIEEPDIDAEVLLRHATGLDKNQLYLRYDRELTDNESRMLDDSIQRRLKGEPIAYILGYKEFFGLKFEVNPSILIPRPETELLVEKALETARHQNTRLIADMGTGCGAIAVSLAKHLPDALIYAVDISEAALKTAESNCKKHNVDAQMKLLQGNLLEPLPEPVDLIVANLPYVKDADYETMPIKITKYEPKTALAAGSDGLDFIKELLTTANDKLRQNGTILLEIGYDQGEAVLKLANTYFPKAAAQLYTDLAGLDRVLSIKT